MSNFYSYEDIHKTISYVASEQSPVGLFVYIYFPASLAVHRLVPTLIFYKSIFKIMLLWIGSSECRKTEDTRHTWVLMEVFPGSLIPKVHLALFANTVQKLLIISFSSVLGSKKTLTPFGASYKPKLDT